jgi:hypothetical protein
MSRNLLVALDPFATHSRAKIEKNLASNHGIV